MAHLAFSCDGSIKQQRAGPSAQSLSIDKKSKREVIGNAISQEYRLWKYIYWLSKKVSSGIKKMIIVLMR
jgi:hypothetical protein